jgi:hypothetical protein
MSQHDLKVHITVSPKATIYLQREIGLGFGDGDGDGLWAVGPELQGCWIQYGRFLTSNKLNPLCT